MIGHVVLLGGRNQRYVEIALTLTIKIVDLFIRVMRSLDQSSFYRSYVRTMYVLLASLALAS